MPAKKQKKGGGAKAKKKANKNQQQKVKKIVEDKTFGMKNKNKSAKIKRFIAQTQREASTRGKTPQELRDQARAKAEKYAKARAKKEMKQRMKDEGMRIKPPHVPEGRDPKEFVCPFWKAGTCNKKGNKCKWAHDHNAGRKVAKKNVYEDARDMSKWNQEELEGAVSNLNRKKGFVPNQTDIVCKYFIEAIQNKKFGHFWACPNGNQTCIYRHALPKGYVLNTDTKIDKEDDQALLAERLEAERAALNPLECTDMTEELFMAWKKRRDVEEIKEVEQKRLKAAGKKGRTKGLHTLSGRALFTFDSSLFEDNANAADDVDLQFEDIKEEGEETAATTTTTAATPTTTTTAAVVSTEGDVTVDASLFDDDDDDLPSDSD